MALTASVGVLGAGLIARAFMEQLAQQSSYLQTHLGVSIAVTAVSNSRRQVLSTAALQATNWQASLAASSQPADPDALAQHVASQAPLAILVDATASDELPTHYATWIVQQRLHIVTPNKKLGAGPLQRYHATQRACAQAGRLFLAEASVGAGLPVMSTLRDLLDTGDKVLCIEGVLSGTLSFLFNAWAPGSPFSAVVQQAKALGFTEPDPREDLSGMDVARKVVILARACGLQLSLSDLVVASLVPPELAALPSAQDYLARLHEFDAAMAQQAEAAAARREVLRYVGCVDVAAGTASVTTRTYPAHHAFAQLSGSDNLIAFTTQRYGSQQPLIVRGPGAGAAVTAAGVFADVLTVLRSAGARG